MNSDILQVCDQINKLCRNVKKDSEGRKTIIYVNEKLHALEEYWTTFKRLTNLPTEEEIPDLIHTTKEEYHQLKKSLQQRQEHLHSTQRQPTGIMTDLNISLFFKIIPTFDGKTSEVHKFLTCCDVIYKTLTTVESKKQFVEFLSTKTSGRAYDVLRYKNLKTFAEIRKEFQIQFLEKKSLAQLQSELLLIKQSPSERVSDFSNKVEKLLSDLNSVSSSQASTTDLPETLANFNHQTALRAFQEGLREPIKTIIKASRFTQLHEAITSALNEDVQNSTKTNSCNSCGKPGHYSKDCRRNIVCNNCKKNGHYTRDCRNQAPSFNRSFSNRNTPTRINQISLDCRYCKNKGHTIEMCRKRIYNNDRTQSNVNSNASSNPNRQTSMSGNYVPRGSQSNEVSAQTFQ